MNLIISDKSYHREGLLHEILVWRRPSLSAEAYLAAASPGMPGSGHRFGITLLTLIVSGWTSIVLRDKLK